ncbi:hypothetical protein P7C70_g2608, partial [Phenoliferia sp. Uapishka_3]
MVYTLPLLFPPSLSLLSLRRPHDQSSILSSILIVQTLRMGQFDGSIGCFVAGTMLSCVAFGVNAAQGWTYYSTFPNDRRLYFLLVTGLLSLDLAHTVFSCWTVYDATVSHFGNLAHLAKAPWMFAVDPLMTGIVASVVQFFYAYRVYVMSKRGFALPLVICTFSAIQLGFACGGTAQIFHLQYYSKFQSWTYGVTIWLVCAAVADLFITGSLVYYLQRRKENVLQATSSVCQKLTTLIIQTNGLTAACAVIDAILFATLSTSWHVTVNLCLIKLYINSVLVSLNARADLERALLRSVASSAAGSPTLMTPSGFGAFDVSAFVKTLPSAVLVETSQSVFTELMSTEEFERWKSVGPRRGEEPREEIPRDNSGSTLEIC